MNEQLIASKNNSLISSKFRQKGGHLTVSTNLQNLLRDALLNNTYDYNVMHDTLKNTWANSYSYLYQLQKSYIEYEEHEYISNDVASRDATHIGHLYINKLLQPCFDIDYDFIHVINREEFKQSKFNKDYRCICGKSTGHESVDKECNECKTLVKYRASTFTITDMVDNPHIFNKLPVILIDGKAIWDYKLSAQNGKFTVILPFNNTFVISISLTSSYESN